MNYKQQTLNTSSRAVDCSFNPVVTPTPRPPEIIHKGLNRNPPQTHVRLSDSASLSLPLALSHTQARTNIHAHFHSTHGGVQK